LQFVLEQFDGFVERDLERMRLRLGSTTLFVVVRDGLDRDGRKVGVVAASGFDVGPCAGFVFDAQHPHGAKFSVSFLIGIETFGRAIHGEFASTALNHDAINIFLMDATAFAAVRVESRK